MAAATVIPAAITYTKVAAVKKFVVGFRGGAFGQPQGMLLAAMFFAKTVLLIECG